MFRRYGFAWVTAGLFLFTLIGHWVVGWFAYLDEQRNLILEPNVAEYLLQATRDTLENWQSEFLQLVWQVAGLSFLLYHGSPQSKDSQDKMESIVEDIQEKVDALTRR